MYKPTIAGVVLTLNEECDIQRALSSLSWCDEIIVLDSGSTDRTQQISEQLRATFIVHKQSPPFLIAEQRNWALRSSIIKSEWLLFLDADEEISPALSTEIQQSLLTQSYDAYELTPRYWFLGKWLKRTQGYPNWHPRLIRRGYNHFVGGVWEDFAKKNRVGRILTPYEHYGFSKGIDDWLSRHLRYATWDAEHTLDILNGNLSLKRDTPRYRRLRTLQARLWFLRPVFRFFQKYFLQLGILEGWQGLLYSTLISFYDIIVIIKVLEASFRKNNKQL